MNSASQQNVPLFLDDGAPVGSRVFTGGQPLVGDVLLLDGSLYRVRSRRWFGDELQVILERVED